MDKIKQLCREMAKDPDIMTLEDILEAATEGIILSKKLNNPILSNPIIGGILGVSCEASIRVAKISKRLAQENVKAPAYKLEKNN